MATAFTSLCILPRVCDTVISHSRRMGSGLSGHPFADYRGRRSKDSAPKDAQDWRDERLGMNSTHTASRTEPLELVVAPQKMDVPGPCLTSRD